MNKIFIAPLILTLSLHSASAQLTLELTQTNGYYGIVNLSSSGYKYIDYSGISPNFWGYPGTSGPGIHIRNLDGSLFRTLALPSTTDSGAAFVQPFYLSETLFDTDSSNIEYLISYFFNDQHNQTQSRTMIVGETGTILFSEYYSRTFEIFTTGRYYYSIYATDQGTKLQLFYYYIDSLGAGNYLYNKVFSLPGSYPTGVNNAALPEIESAIFPNPSIADAMIRIHLPEAITKASIMFYNTTGKLIKELTINPKDEIIRLDNSTLSSGIYFYHFKTDPPVASQSKKMIIVR